MKTDFIFFGNGHIARMTLESMSKFGIAPKIIITSPDAPKGRGREDTPNLTSQWAYENNIEQIKPAKLDEAFINRLTEICKTRQIRLFVVIDYGNILPASLLKIPQLGTINMHPSLLPRLRGPSPIRSAILHDEKKIGISLMLVDEEMDHGPIIAQQIVDTPYHPMRGHELDRLMADTGGNLLATTLQQYADGKITPLAQDHSRATFCKLFTKEMGQINIEDDPYTNLLKIRAFEGWPGTFTFVKKNGKIIRLKIIDAEIEKNTLKLLRVTPEGKREMSYEEFSR